MSASTWIGLAGFIFIVGFILFAFLQGMRVKPDPENKPRSNDGDGGSPLV